MSACAVVEKVHVYFNDKQVRLISAKRTEYFDVVTGEGARLSEVSFRLTGTRSTAAIRAANPKVRSETLPAGTILRIPTKLLKPGMRSQSKFTQRQPVEPQAEPQKPPKPDGKTGKQNNKRIDKITLPPKGQEEEILPGQDYNPQQDTTGDEEYYDTPFKRESGEIVPYTPPKPTPNTQQTEEEKLRDKYKDIMKELE